MNGWFLSCLLLAPVTQPLLSADPDLKRFEFSETHMGTQFRLVLYAMDEAGAGAAARAAFARITDLDNHLSDYKPASELMQLCQKAGGPPVHVGPDLFRVLEYGQEVSRLSDGAFDVTVGPLTKLWRQTRKTRKLPDPEKLKQARALVGYQHVKLDPGARTVQLMKPGMQLDFGGIAKGYAGDAVLETLRQHGITQALLAAGGDITVGAAPPGKKGWVIGIAPVANPDHAPSRYLVLENQAVSTSGDAEQFVEIQGIRYSHILDPRTGLGLRGRMSATVVAPKGIQSDSLTKTVAVLGAERGFKIIDSVAGAAAMLVIKTEKGEQIFESKRFGAIPQQATRP